VLTPIKKSTVDSPDLKKLSTFEEHSEHHNNILSLDKKTSSLGLPGKEENSVITSTLRNSVDKDLMEKNTIFERYANYAFSILQSEEIPLDHQKSQDDTNYLCEAFFISGLTPNKAAVLYEGKSEYLASCKHKDCSELAAYNPTIVAKYPTKDSKNLDINFLSAKLCFKSGIKPCYCDDESKIKFPSSYMTIITNHNGTKYYVINYFYFVKYDQNTFKKMFGVNLFNDTLKLDKLTEENKLLSSDNLKQNEQKFKRKLQLCEKYGFKDFVYLPYGASLVSKHPIAGKMEKFLELIVNSMSNSITNSKETFNYEEVNKILKNLINEIILPPMNTKVLFYLPYCFTPFELYGASLANPPEINFSTKFLLEIFSIENIMQIHHLMLLEQKIIFIGEEQSLISEVIDMFICLLYPFKWWHSYIPVLPESLLEYIRAMNPYLIGLEENLLNTASPFIYEEDSIYMVFINKNYIDNSSNKKKKKLNKKSLL